MRETKLKTTRLKEGLKQWEVAEKAGVAIRTYKNYEAGKYSKSISNAIRIAQALHSDVESLFTPQE